MADNRRFGRGTRLPNKDNSSNSALSKLKSLNICDENINPSENLAKRTSPDINLNDRPINLQCNYVPITFEDKNIFIYSVTIMPEIDSTAIKHRILHQFDDILPEIRVFDGNVLYTIEELDKKPFVLKGTLPNKPDQDITCTLSFAKCIKSNESIALINIIFRKILRILNLKLIGRNYYNVDLSVPIPKHKLHIWPGFITSIKSLESGIFLNIDTTHRFLHMQTIYDQMAALYASNPNQKNFHSTCLKTIIGQTVITRYNNKSYRIDDIDFDKSPKDTFMWNGKLTTYIEYYRVMYGKEIADEDQPLLLHRSKDKSLSKKSIFQSNTNDMVTPEVERLICLIPELCYMTGIDDETRLNYSIMKELNSYIHSNPSERFASVHKFLETLHTSPEALNELKKWGITIGMNTLNIGGRYFPNEKLICQQGRLQFSVDPASGWIGKLSKAHLLSAVSINDWVCVYMLRDKSHVSRFINCLVVSGNQLGMNISMPRFKEISNDKIETYISSIRGQINNKTSLVMIIVPTQREDRYAAIKRMLCCDIPLASQVINTKTISNPKKINSIAQRVAMQINCKLGGELWAVNIPLKNFMAIGIDVYHSASTKINHSTVAFVSSLSSSLTKWYTSTASSNPGEIVVTIKSFLIKALEKYVKYNGVYPDRIVVFRDGVGYGQLNAVRTVELNAFIEYLDNCSLFQIKPMLIFLVIVKRNNTRLYDADNLSNSNIISNPKPGTVLDSLLTTSISCPSFYLISQHFNQGTITPTCYQVLYNNSNLSMRQIQLLSYKCTYLYYNWPGTISVPAPCQYAHKAAYLAGQSLMKQAHSALSDTLYYL